MEVSGVHLLFTFPPPGEYLVGNQVNIWISAAYLRIFHNWIWSEQNRERRSSLASPGTLAGFNKTASPGFVCLCLKVFFKYFPFECSLNSLNSLYLQPRLFLEVEQWQSWLQVQGIQRRRLVPNSHDQLRRIEGRKRERAKVVFNFSPRERCNVWFRNLPFRINFLPGRERDVWTREGVPLPKESLPRNVLPSRAEGLARERGYMGGRWGGGGGGEGSPGGAVGALPKRAAPSPRTPPSLQHQGPADHPHFITPPVTVF